MGKHREQRLELNWQECREAGAGERNHWRNSMSLSVFPPSRSSLLGVYWTPVPCPAPSPGVLQVKGTDRHIHSICPCANSWGGSGVNPELGVAHRWADR